MELALYAPGAGYYVRGRSPFGIHGDFYTAEQLQPVFGTLIAQYVAAVARGDGIARGFPRRGTRRGSQARWRLRWPDSATRPWKRSAAGCRRGVSRASCSPTSSSTRCRFVWRCGARRTFREMLVAFDGERFALSKARRAEARRSNTCGVIYADAADGAVVEIHLRCARVARAHRRGASRAAASSSTTATRRASSSAIREGTLMSYHRHAASRGRACRIPATATSPRTSRSPRSRSGADRGLEVRAFREACADLLGAGEARSVRRGARRGATKAKRCRRRLQLKTLLFGMGETFRLCWLEKDVSTNKKGPDHSGPWLKSLTCLQSLCGTPLLTSFSSEQPSSSRALQLSWLRSSSIDSPKHQICDLEKDRSVIHI